MTVNMIWGIERERHRHCNSTSYDWQDVGSVDVGYSINIDSYYCRNIEENKKKTTTMYDPLIVLSVQKNHNKVNTTMHKIIFVYKTVEKKGEQQQIKKKWSYI